MLHWLIQRRVAIQRQHYGHRPLKARECARKEHAVRGEDIVSAGNLVHFFYTNSLTNEEVAVVRW